MAGKGVPLSQPATALADDLKHLAELKDQRDNAKTTSKAVEAEYRQHEARLVEAMSSNDMTSCKVDGIGSFTVASRTFSAIKNLKKLIQWAETNKLIKDIKWLDDGRVMIPFDIAMAVDDDGNEKPTLLNGIVRADAYKKQLNEYLSEAISEGLEIPPGLGVSVTNYISLRRSH